MKYDNRFLKIVLWEALENAPILAAFLWAVKLHAENFLLAFIVLSIGAAASAALIHLTERKKYGIQPTLKETVVNFIVFSVMPIPFIFYVSANDIWWSNWLTDVLLGILAGISVAVGESYGWKEKSRVKVHAISMASMSIISLWGIRFMHNAELLLSVIVIGIFFNLLVSSIIVWFDYWPIKESANTLQA